MRGYPFVQVLGLVGALAMLLPSLTAAEPLIPERRLVLIENTDLPGGDIASIFDTTLEACERACLTNNRCTAFTFNTKNGSCFPKSGAGAPIAYDGAYSGNVLTAAPGAEALAKLRRAELGFIPAWEDGSFTAQAAAMAGEHITNL